MARSAFRRCAATKEAARGGEQRRVVPVRLGHPSLPKTLVVSIQSVFGHPVHLCIYRLRPECALHLACRTIRQEEVALMSLCDCGAKNVRAWPHTLERISQKSLEE